MDNIVKTTIEAAVSAGADLAGADLAHADLARACLARADLAGANLAHVNLAGANLAGANLAGADLDEKDNHIIDIKQVGNIGSRKGYTVAFRLEKSIKIKCGCFFGTLDEFASKVEKTHADTNYGREYKAMIEFIQKIWSNHTGTPRLLPGQ